MKRLTAFIFLCVLAFQAQAFDRTLRLDYIFSGDCSSAAIALDGMSVTEGWFGRSVNMDRIPVRGNGVLRMKDAASGQVLYATSFSTLFQEWQETPEAREVRKSFENTYLVPMPADSAIVEITLFDMRGDTTCFFTHPVKPDDILIRKAAASEVETRWLLKSGEPERCIDIVILAEGYTAAEMDTFYADAAIAIESLLSHEPFGSMKEKFNILAVAAPSQESGVSVPREGVWKQTAVNSHFDTFYSNRYLTTSDIFHMHDLLSGLPYEHLIILANTDTYGGGGIYNSYTLTTAHHKQFKPVVVHEFGHSFGALADEYDYAGDEDPYYFPDVEPWERNITTQYDFQSKWKDMIELGVKGVGLVEGAGYQHKGVWRACEDCRMRTNKAGTFCPVCQRAIRDIILFYTEESR